MSVKKPSPPPGSHELAFGPTMPALMPLPPICGTARLTIERITRLRLTVDNASITARDEGDRLDLHITAHAHAEGLTLPAHVGVSILGEDGTDDIAKRSWVTLEEGRPLVLPFAQRARGSTVVVRLCFADALCNRTLDVI